MYLYKAGTRSSVLIKRGALISEVSFKRDSTVCRNDNLHMPYKFRAFEGWLQQVEPRVKSYHSGNGILTQVRVESIAENFQIHYSTNKHRCLT